MVVRNTAFLFVAMAFLLACGDDASSGSGGGNNSNADQPPVAVGDIAYTPENTPVSIPALSNDVDPEGGAIYLIEGSVDGPSSSGGTMFVPNELGPDIEYTPPADFRGADTFYYSIHDEGGQTASAQVKIFVGDNEAPMANDDTGLTSEELTVTISVFDNDSDADGDPFSFTGFTQPDNGFVTNIGTELVYRPFYGFVGLDIFTYSIEDEMGGTATATVFVTVVSALDFTPDTGWRLQEEATVPRVGIDPITENVSLYFHSEVNEYRAISADGLIFPDSTGWTVQDQADRSFDPRITLMPIPDGISGDSIYRIYGFDQGLSAFTSADSSDGVSFLNPGVAHYTPDASHLPIGVSTTFVEPDGDVVLLYIGEMGVEFGHSTRRAVSSDNGENFVFENDDVFEDQALALGEQHVDPLVVALPTGGYRCLTMVQGVNAPNPGVSKVGVIHSWISEDGEDWLWEGPVLTPDAFTECDVWSLNGPSLLALPDGGWRVYCGGFGDIGLGVVSAVSN